jgi:hypothetical protein
MGMISAGAAGVGAEKAVAVGDNKAAGMNVPAYMGSGLIAVQDFNAVLAFG